MCDVLGRSNPHKYKDRPRFPFELCDPSTKIQQALSELFGSLEYMGQSKVLSVN